MKTKQEETEEERCDDEEEDVFGIFEGDQQILKGQQFDLLNEPWSLMRSIECLRPSCGGFARH